MNTQKIILLILFCLVLSSSGCEDEKKYQQKYDEGYSAGHKKGIDDGIEQGKKLGQTQGYDRGYLEGEKVGREEGEKIGYKKGETDGKERGYNSGISKGLEITQKMSEKLSRYIIDSIYKSNFAKERESIKELGENVGYSKGYKIGVEKGNEQGFYLGKKIGYEEGFIAGVDSGLVKGKLENLEKAKIYWKEIGFAEGQNKASKDYETRLKELYDKSHLIQSESKTTFNVISILSLFLNFSLFLSILGYSFWTNKTNLEPFFRVLPSIFAGIIGGVICAVVLNSNYEISREWKYLSSFISLMLITFLQTKYRKYDLKQFESKHTIIALMITAVFVFCALLPFA